MPGSRRDAASTAGTTSTSQQKPRLYVEANRESSTRSRATSISSQATIPQPLTPLSSGQQLREFAVLGTAPAEDPTADAFISLNSDTFLGITDEQLQALNTGDYLWWLSDLNGLQLACFLDISSSALNDEGCKTVHISVVWNPYGKCDPQHSFQSSPARLQQHFFQGQAVQWRHEGILQQGEVNGHQLSPSGMEYMVDAHGSADWCPWVPSCDLSAVSSLGQSSSESYTGLLDDSAAIATGVYDSHEFLPPSPLIPSSPVRATAGTQPSSPRPNSPDASKTAEASPLAPLAARFCAPTHKAASKASADAATCSLRCAAATRTHEHPSRQLSIGRSGTKSSSSQTPDPKISASLLGEDMSEAACLRLLQQEEEEAKKGKGPSAASTAVGGFVAEDDSDDADLLMDLSWANVKSRGS
ncbi:hypothetical protein WJX74_007065 [Apatococcus lobatus]|uniref:Uncharacterized protein n=1 Tax=Apatococcus lobatus TaxID=904363 RepID=A0AAW1RQG7_9CHLO